MVKAKNLGGSYGKEIRLTVFLIKGEYNTIDEFIDAGSLQRFPTPTGTLFFRSGFTNPAPWASVFRDVSALRTISVRASSVQMIDDVD